MTLLIYYLLQLLSHPGPFSQEGYWEWTLPMPCLPRQKGRKAISVAKDRIVRICAIEKLTTIDDVRAVLKDAMNRSNTTKFIPLLERSPAFTLRWSEKSE